MPTIDFNCDLGEGCGSDAAIVPLISSASIACGGHAGDATSMAEAVALCQRHGVAIGAHPSYDDRAGFGRHDMDVAVDAITVLVTTQVTALAEVCITAGARLRHVKPHGALYNRAARDPAVAIAIATAVHAFDPRLVLFGLSDSCLTAAGTAVGLRVAHEVFAERRYDADGTLAPRGTPGAVIDTEEDALAQVRSLIEDSVVFARDGTRVHLHADTLCLHGDRPDAAAFARSLRRALEAAAVDIRAPEQNA